MSWTLRIPRGTSLGGLRRGAEPRNPLVGNRNDSLRRSGSRKQRKGFHGHSKKRSSLSHLCPRDRGRHQLGRTSQVGLEARQGGICFGAERLGPREQGAEALGAPVRRGSHSADRRESESERERERRGAKSNASSPFFFFLLSSFQRKRVVFLFLEHARNSLRPLSREHVARRGPLAVKRAPKDRSPAFLSSLFFSSSAVDRRLVKKKRIDTQHQMASSPSENGNPFAALAAGALTNSVLVPPAHAEEREMQKTEKEREKKKAMIN